MRVVLRRYPALRRLPDGIGVVVVAAPKLPSQVLIITFETTNGTVLFGSAPVCGPTEAEMPVPLPAMAIPVAAPSAIAASRNATADPCVAIGVVGLLFVIAAFAVFHFALPAESSDLAAKGLLWVAIVFTALAIAFGVLTFWHYGDDGQRWHHHGGLFVPMMIFAALAFSNFLSLLFMPRGWPPDDKDRR